MIASTLSEINGHIGKALIGVGVLIVMIRVMGQMAQGRGLDDFGVILKDFAIMSILIFNFDSVFSLLNYLPEQLSILSKTDKVSFEASLKQLFDKSPSRSFLFIEIDGTWMSQVRAFCIEVSKLLYKLIVSLAMAFFSLIVFLRFMLNMRLLSSLFFGVIIFSGFFPLIFVILDSIILFWFNDAVEGDSLPSALGATVTGGAGYILLPFLGLKGAIATSDSAQSAILKGYKTISAATRGYSSVNRGLASWGESSELKRSRSQVSGGRAKSEFELYKEAKKKRKEREKDIKSRNRRLGINPKEELARERVEFDRQWKDHKREKGKTKSAFRGLKKGFRHSYANTKESAALAKKKYLPNKANGKIRLKPRNHSGQENLKEKEAFYMNGANKNDYLKSKNRAFNLNGNKGVEINNAYNAQASKLKANKEKVKFRQSKTERPNPRTPETRHMSGSERDQCAEAKRSRMMPGHHKKEIKKDNRRKK